MPTPQELVHKLEVEGGMRYFRIGLGALLVVLLIGSQNWLAYKNMFTQEGMDAAQLGRSISEGKGFTTLFIRPFSMYLIKRRDVQIHGEGPTEGKADQWRIKEKHPDLANPPVYPLVLAGLMKVLPFDYRASDTKPFWSTDGRFARYQPDFLIAVFNELLFFALILVVYGLARRLFGVPVARLSAILLFGTELFWRFVSSGISTMLLLLIFAGLVWCLLLVEQEGREPARSPASLVMLALLTGLLTGLGGMTRYAFGWLIIPVLAFLLLFAGQRRLVVSVVALIAFAGVMTPWMARNYHLSGAPFGTANYAVMENTPALFPEHRLERSLEPDLRRFPLRVLEHKLLLNARQIIQNDLPRLGGSLVAAFFLAGLLIRFGDPAVGRLRYFLIMCLVILGLAQALGRTQLSEDSPEINSENLLVLVAPLALVYGVSLFYLLLDQLDLPIREMRYGAIVLFGLIVCSPMIFTLLPPRSGPVSYPPYYPPAVEAAALEWTKENDLTMSDIPWAMAWYGRRQSLWLTANGQPEFFAINDYQKPVQMLYLGTVTLDSRFVTHWVLGGDQNWGNFIMACLVRRAQQGLPGPPPNFPLRYWQAGWPSQFVLTTRERPIRTPQQR